MMLWVNGDDLPAATSNQQHPVQSLYEDLQELHVWPQSEGEVWRTAVHEGDI